MLGELALVKWQLGQTLLPEHFEAQEAALLADSSIKFGFTGKPFYGLAQLSMDLSETIKGVVRVTEFCCILPKGQLVKLNGNAKFIFNQDTLVLPKPSVTADLYINIYQSSTDGIDDRLIELNQDSLPDNHLSSNELVRKTYVLELASIPASTDSKSNGPDSTLDRTRLKLLDQFKLIRFSKDNAQNWLPDDSFLPPLLVLSNSILFKSRQEKLNTYLSCFEKELKKPIVDVMKENAVAQSKIKCSISKTGCEELQKLPEIGRETNIKTYLPNLLSNLYKTQRMLQTITRQDTEILLHPYDLFCQLESFYVDCKLYRNSLPNKHELVYRHNALADVFDRLIGLLDEAIFFKEYSYLHTALREINGVYSCTIDNNSLQENKRYYLAIYLESKAMLTHCPPPQRITTIERLRGEESATAEGLNLTMITDDSTIARLNQSSHNYRIAQYYEVQKDGEWHEIVKGKNFAFFGQSEFRGCLFDFITETKNYAARG